MNVKAQAKRIVRAGLCGPAVTVAAAIVMLVFVRQENESALVISQEVYGPIIWPQVMFLGVIVSAGLMFTSRFADCFIRNKEAPAGSSDQDDLKLFLGFCAVMLYGIGMLYIGFALSTFLFLICWMFLGGMRNPVTIGSAGLAGTVGLLFLFIKVAYLPLPRGVGVFDDIHVALYRSLGIF